MEHFIDFADLVTLDHKVGTRIFDKYLPLVLLHLQELLEKYSADASTPANHPDSRSGSQWANIVKQIVFDQNEKNKIEN